VLHGETPEGPVLTFADGTTLFLPVDGEPEAVAPEELTNGFMYPTSPN
jgi:hypothetical protein